MFSSPRPQHHARIAAVAAQDRLSAFNEVAAQLQMLQGAAAAAHPVGPGGAGAMSGLMATSMPKVPHSGADIW